MTAGQLQKLIVSILVRILWAGTLLWIAIGAAFGVWLAVFGPRYALWFFVRFVLGWEV